MTDRGSEPSVHPLLQGSVYHAPLGSRGPKPLQLGRLVLAMDGATSGPAQAVLTGQISGHLKQAEPSSQGRTAFPVQEPDPKNWSLHSSLKF